MRLLAAAPSITLSPSTRILTVVMALFFAIAVIELIRRRRLQERYTALWFLYTLLLLVVAIVPATLGLASELLGISNTTSALFLMAFIAIGTLLLSMTVTLSKQSEQITKLAQEASLLRLELERILKDKEVKEDSSKASD